MNDVTFALKEIRAATGMTQTRLGAEIGISLQGVQHLESAKLKSISFERLGKICQVLGVAPADLIRLQDDTQQRRDRNATQGELQGLNALAARIHTANKDKGFWEGDRNRGEVVALIHSEVSELLEAYRAGNPASEKIAGFSQAEEELADVIIRCLDLAGAEGWAVSQAIAAKLEYNEARPRKHGKKF